MKEGQTAFTNICGTEGCDNLTETCFQLVCDECKARLEEEREIHRKSMDAHWLNE